MENRKSLFSISHDHFHGLLVAQIIKKGSTISNDLFKSIDDKVNYTIHFYDQELANHFYIEEHILQPLIRGISNEIDKLFNELIEQHKLISDLINSLKDNMDLENKLNNISAALEHHINQEERVLFPKIQETLSVHELEMLSKNLMKNGYEHIFKF